MSKKQVGLGAGRFAPTSQFGLVNELLKPGPQPAPVAPPATIIKTEEKPEVKAKAEARNKAKPTIQSSNELFKVNAFATAPDKKVSTAAAYNIDKDAARRLKIHAAIHNVSASRIVNDLIIGYLAEHETK